MTYTAMDASQSAWAAQDSQPQLPELPASAPAPGRHSLLQPSASLLAGLPGSLRPAAAAEQPRLTGPTLQPPAEPQPAADPGSPQTAAVPDTEEQMTPELRSPAQPTPAGQLSRQRSAQSKAPQPLPSGVQAAPERDEQDRRTKVKPAAPVAQAAAAPKVAPFLHSSLSQRLPLLAELHSCACI